MTLDFERYRPLIQEFALDDAQADELITLVFDTVGVLVAAEFDRRAVPVSGGKPETLSAHSRAKAPGSELNSCRKTFSIAAQGGANDDNA